MSRRTPKQVEKKTIADIFREAHATVTIGVTCGFAAITLENNMKHKVQFYTEEGYTADDHEHEAEDIQKIAYFIDQLNSLKLDQYVTTK